MINNQQKLRKNQRRLILFLTLFLMGNSLAFAESIGDKVVLNTLLLEARGEGLLGMQCVAEVVRHRAKRKGISFDRVCLAKRQFSAWNSPITALAKIDKFTKKDYKLASMSWEYSKTSDITKGATHYYAYKLMPMPYWSYKMKFTRTIGGHSFFKE